MKVSVNILGKEGEREVELEEGADSIKLIESIGLFPDAVLVKRNGLVIPLDEPLHNTDRVTLIVVSSGG